MIFFSYSAGYYMFITPVNKPNSTARLISFPQPAGQMLCVSFLYRMFGNSIGKCNRYDTLKRHCQL